MFPYIFSCSILGYNFISSLLTSGGSGGHIQVIWRRGSPWVWEILVIWLITQQVFYLTFQVSCCGYFWPTWLHTTKGIAINRFRCIALVWQRCLCVCSCGSPKKFLFYNFGSGHLLQRNISSVSHIWPTAWMHFIEIFLSQNDNSLSWILTSVCRHQNPSLLGLYLQRWGSSGGLHVTGWFSDLWILFLCVSAAL